MPLADLLERVGGEVLSFIVQEAARLLAVAKVLEGVGPKRRRDAVRLRRSVELLGTVSKAARAEVRRRMRLRPECALPGLGRTSNVGE